MIEIDSRAPCSSSRRRAIGILEWKFLKGQDLSRIPIAQGFLEWKFLKGQDLWTFGKSGFSTWAVPEEGRTATLYHALLDLGGRGWSWGWPLLAGRKCASV